MKLKFNLLILALGLFYLSAQADEFTREQHSGYLKSSIKALDITNKFGSITINDFGGDSVTVDVKITIDNGNENKANYLMDQIDINTRKVGSLLKVETKIDDNFKTKQNFSIDYTINIPADRDLKVSNKFGSVAVSSLNANGNFDISYGNINTGSLAAPDNQMIIMDISYGKADIESVNRMQIALQYSKLFLGEAQALRVESKYSGINLKEIKTMDLDSKYDGVQIEELGDLKADSKYTNYDIEELKKSLGLDTQYGSVRVEEVASGFDNIDITNMYGGIDIGLGNANYYLDASCDYCDIKYPDEKFKGSREKDNHTLNIKGTIGAESAQKVTINSRYGGVKLK
ncbi:MAG TPA: hypothetical protein VKA27_04965 [Sunxiuqinia sp.]|nr:hypothetical protein [Sunxiuqinia sp.]